MKRTPVLEKAVVTRIVASLRKIPGVVVRKRHGTAMGMAGDPDLYGTINGKHFEIEVKRPNDPSSRLTELQTQRLIEWTHGGAITGVARTVDEALAVLGVKRQRAELQIPTWICSGCGQYEWESDDPPARCPKCGHTRFEREAQV